MNAVANADPGWLCRPLRVSPYRTRRVRVAVLASGVVLRSRLALWAAAQRGRAAQLPALLLTLRKACRTAAGPMSFLVAASAARSALHIAVRNDHKECAAVLKQWLCKC